MTDNRTTELTATERICEQLEAVGVSFVRSEQIIEGTYWGVTWFDGETTFEFRENDKRADLIAFNATPEQAIAATLGSDASAVRLAERLRSIADEMRHVGASTMTPHELLAFYASEVDKVADSLMFATTLGSERHMETCEPPYNELIRCLENDWHIKVGWDGLRKFWCIELTEEGVKLRDATRGTLTAEQVHEAIERHITFYEGGDYDEHAIADELNAELGSGTCHMSFIDEYETASGEEEYLCECSECGYRRWEHAHDLPLFCSKCGRKVTP